LGWWLSWWPRRFRFFKVVWLARSVRVMGVYSFAGMGEAGEQVRLDYSICWFPVGKDTVWFNGIGEPAFPARGSDPGEVPGR